MYIYLYTYFHDYVCIMYKQVFIFVYTIVQTMFLLHERLWFMNYDSLLKSYYWVFNDKIVRFMQHNL